MLIWVKESETMLIAYLEYSHFNIALDQLIEINLK